MALEACEFWSAICETRVAKEALAEFLPRLVPVLLQGMVYTEVTPQQQQPLQQQQLLQGMVYTEVTPQQQQPLLQQQLLQGMVYTVVQPQQQQQKQQQQQQQQQQRQQLGRWISS